MTSSHARLDGRTARSERTRTAIIDALHGLLLEGVGEPSAREIADRANVSLRSVFQRFEDVESVYAEVAERQAVRLRPFLEPIDSTRPLTDRIERVVAARDEMFALIAPVRRAINMQRAAKTSQNVRNGLLQLHRAQREQIASTFSAEINGDERRLVQIDVWLSFETWDQFTVQQGLTRAATRGHLESLLHSMLAD